MNHARVAKWVTMVVMGLAILSCSDINKQNGPVQLIVTISQTIHQIDLENGASGCDQNLGVVRLNTLLLQGGLSQIPTDTRFDSVKLVNYRVTYVRTDGGHQTPAPFVRSISGTIDLNQAPTALNDFIAFPPNAFDQAPFAALLPSNGGRDPETGLKTVQMDIVLEVFGETIAGERVSGSARMPLDFCFHCGGCL